jgi:hypothetical protein
VTSTVAQEFKTGDTVLYVSHPLHILREFYKPGLCRCITRDTRCGNACRLIIQIDEEKILVTRIRR